MYEYQYMMYDMNLLEKSLEGIKAAVQGEREDEIFYDYLISVAPTEEEKKIIASIRDDERGHNKMFRQIYKNITGADVPQGKDEEFIKPISYLDGIKNALFGELGAVEKYREIRRGLPSTMHRDMLFNIITDEIKHSSKYNYLYTLNSQSMQRDLHRIMAAAIDTSKFSPDDWVNYINPLVVRALAEQKQGINMEHLFQEFILAGVLVGLGNTPQQAIEQVENWEETGASKLLMESKMKQASTPSIPFILS
jgi:rubrerythrin